jgi:hypothetical protein
MKRVFKIQLPILSESEVCRPHFRMRNVGIPGIADILVTPLYDHVAIQKNTATVKLIWFTIPVGGQYTPTGSSATTYAKNRYNTNMTQASLLPLPQKFLAKAVAIFPHPGTTPADMNNLLGQVHIQFVVNEKTYLEQLAGRLPGGGGPAISTSEAIYDQGSATVVSVWGSANGSPMAANLYTITSAGGQAGAATEPAIPFLEIDQGQTFQVNFDPTLYQGAGTAGAFTTDNTAAAAGPAARGLDCHCYIDGTLFRSAT